jgi:hypothetical protein
VRNKRVSEDGVELNVGLADAKTSFEGGELHKHKWERPEISGQVTGSASGRKLSHRGRRHRGQTTGRHETFYYKPS